jgi:hypothetical protein
MRLGPGSASQVEASQTRTYTLNVGTQYAIEKQVCGPTLTLSGYEWIHTLNPSELLLCTNTVVHVCKAFLYRRARL